MRTLFFTAAALVLLGSSPAWAQTFTFFKYDENNDEALTDIDFNEWSNMARCLCDEFAETQDASTATLNIRIRSDTASTNDQVYIYLGDECDSESTSIGDVCRELEVLNLSDFTEEQTVQVPVHWVVDFDNGQCSEQNGGTTTLYVIVGDANNTPSATLTINYDTAPPGEPSSVTAAGGESAVTVRWDEPTTDEENIEYYNVLCSQDGSPLAGASSTGGNWLTTQEVCGQALPDDASAMDTDCSTVRSGLTSGDMYPNPCYVCGSGGPSTRDLRITGLTNGAAYQFAVVAIDRFGNVSAMSEVVSATPVPTTDFAEHYSGAGGAEEGGFCYIATAVYGDYDHADVRQLRGYRDGILARSEAGQRFVAWYYENGPRLVRLQRRVPPLKMVSRLGLEGLVWISRQLTPGSGGADPHRAALPLGVLLLGAMLSLARLASRREEDEDAEDRTDDPEVTL